MLTLEDLAAVVEEMADPAKLDKDMRALSVKVASWTLPQRRMLILNTLELGYSNVRAAMTAEEIIIYVLLVAMKRSQDPFFAKLEAQMKDV